MDPKTSFFLDIQLFGNNTRVEGGWYSFSKVVDSDYTNFKDFVDDILHSYPSGYNDVVKLFYLADESHVEIRTDQDLLAMFAKHESSRVILGSHMFLLLIGTYPMLSSLMLCLVHLPCHKILLSKLSHKAPNLQKLIPMLPNLLKQLTTHWKHIL